MRVCRFVCATKVQRKTQGQKDPCMKKTGDLKAPSELGWIKILEEHWHVSRDSSLIRQ